MSEEKGYSRGDTRYKSWKGWVSLPVKNPPSAQPWTRGVEKAGRRCSSARRPFGRSIRVSSYSLSLLRNIRPFQELHQCRRDQFHRTGKALLDLHHDQRLRILHNMGFGLHTPQGLSLQAAISRPTTLLHLLNTSLRSPSVIRYDQSLRPKASPFIPAISPA